MSITPNMTFIENGFELQEWSGERGKLLEQ